MNNDKTTTVIAGVKQLQSDINAYQGRLDFVKAELDKFTRERDAIKREAENLRAVLQQDAEKKLLLLHAETAKVNELKADLEKQKSEFVGIMNAYKIERNGFERERQTVIDLKANTEAINLKVGQFVRLVKSAAEGL